MSVKCFFLDLDGTLIDSLPSLYEAYVSVLEGYSKTPTKEEFDSLNGPSIREIAKYFKDKYLLDDSVDQIESTYLDRIESCYYSSKPFIETDSFLKESYDKGIALFLVTSSPGKKAKKVLEINGWTAYFSGVISGDQVESSKPHPEIYNLACKRVDFQKEEIVVVEDSINGVKSALGAKLKVYQIVRNDSDVYDESFKITTLSNLL